MNKIYIVTTGSYSNYHIVNVFASRKKAEEYIKIKSKNDEKYRTHRIVYNIEEYTVKDDYLDTNYWRVRIEMHFSEDLEELKHETIMFTLNGADLEEYEISSHEYEISSYFDLCERSKNYLLIFATDVPTTQFDTEEKLEEHYVKVVRDYVAKLKYMVQVDGLSVNEAAVLIDEQIKKEGIV